MSSPRNLFVGLAALVSTAAAQDVPLEFYTNESWPAGLVLGDTYGVAMGDFDGDGWVDLFTLQSGDLWRNVDGEDWELAANLLGLMPAATTRYGAAFGDYDKDGLPDIGCEPRTVMPGDSCFRLLHNLGGGPNFLEVAADPNVIDVDVCMSNSETITWGDVDGDQNLDMILPAYPPTPCGALSGLGNAFLYNLGPNGPGGNYAFTEMAAAAGLLNTSGCRPEGAQLVDLDFDGDLDFYTGGALFRNLSAAGTPFFDQVTASAGITFESIRDEGLAFVDYDLDGDFDLLITYLDPGLGVRLFQARGDGSYVLQSAAIIQDHLVGFRYGLSYGDWDNDGDVDFTTRQVFRRNLAVETGTARFVTATHTVDPLHITNATPAWGDLDRDGDLDCAIANAGEMARLYENTLYDGETAEIDKRYVRIRPVLDSPGIATGLETEFGAVARLVVINDTSRAVRRQFTSSASGYLNQNEYALHFGLPPDPAPANPLVDILFDVSVDFPSTPDVGYVRVDKHVNPVLGRIPLAQLADREITVFRSGKVILDGHEFAPAPAQPTVLTTTNGGLQTPTPSTPVAALTAGAVDQHVGVEFDTLTATDPIRLTEIIVEGQLTPPANCGDGNANMRLWDVTTPGMPELAYEFNAVTEPSNDRSYVPVNALLVPGKLYRLVAAVDQVRLTPLAPIAGPVQVTGGLEFVDASPCDGVAVDGAVLSPTDVGLAFRFHPVAGAAIVDLGGGLAGAAGIPVLSCVGEIRPGTPVTLNLTGAAANAPSGVVIGNSIDPQPLFGGILLPSFDALAVDFSTNSLGEVSLPTSWPTALTPGQSLFFQVGTFDLGAPQLVAFSNAIAATTQP